MLTEHCMTQPCSPGGVAGGVVETETGEEERRLVVVNVYCPMYDQTKEKGMEVGEEARARLHFKTNFYRLLEARCSALERAGK